MAWVESLVREDQYPNEGELNRVIDRSRSLLDHPIDDETPISVATWKRAREFLLNQADVSHKLFGVPLPVPDINPAGEESLDKPKLDSSRSTALQKLPPIAITALNQLTNCVLINKTVNHAVLVRVL